MNRKVLASALVLLAVTATTAGAYVAQSAAVTGQGPSFTFEEVSSEVGFNYTAGGRGISNTNAGVYVSDYDRDGDPDLLATGSEGPVLFENVGGEFRRTNVLPSFEATITSALFLDHDGDGREELLLLPLPGSAPDASRPDDQPLLLGDSSEGFAYAGSVNATLSGYPTGAAAADYDGDGVLDVFVWQNGPWSDRTPVGFRNSSSVGNITDDNGAPNLLLRGTGSGFEEVTNRSGIEGERWTIAASFIDLTGDGRPDIHAANDFNEDILYINRGNGTFRQVRMGDFTDRNEMASEIQDINGDGRPDIFITNIFSGEEGADVGKDTGQLFENRDQYLQGDRAKGNNLLINEGNGSFVDQAGEYGVRRGPHLWGWAAVMADLDNDGDPDLVHANNQRNKITSGGRQMLTAESTYPVAWEFADGQFVSLEASQLGFEKQDGRGMAALDFDRDGDLDILVANNKGTFRLYENQVAETGGGLLGDEDEHAVEILVRGEETYLAHGATVKVVAGNTTQYRFVTSRTDYLSQDSRSLHVGVGEHDTVDSVRIIWDDGTTTTLSDVAADRYLVVYSNGTVTSSPLDG
jgi:hypothetical protein